MKGKDEGKISEMSENIDLKLRQDAIYTPKEPEHTDKLFLYIRGWRRDQLGFSVLDVATDEPDFSDCGVFWVYPKDFCKLFREYTGTRA